MLSLYIGYVSGTTDNYHADRVKCVIPSDKGRKLKDIPYAFPALPKMVHVKPKNGEAVIVLVSNDKETDGQRWYIGPIISQPDKMWYEDFFSLSPTKFLGGGITQPTRSVDNIGDSEGSLPEDGEIAILGRKDTDIVLGDEDVRIRAGVRLTRPNKETVDFNRDAPAYIKLKYHDDSLKTENGDDVQSTATIVADKINLISQNGDEAFKLADKKEGITDEEMAKILEKAHQLPYGDILCDFFSLFIKMFLNHVHPYDGMPPFKEEDPNVANFLSKYGEEAKALEDKLLSKNIRIN